MHKMNKQNKKQKKKQMYNEHNGFLIMFIKYSANKLQTFTEEKSFST